jgi:hypothetical protein
MVKVGGVGGPNDTARTGVTSQGGLTIPPPFRVAAAPGAPGTTARGWLDPANPVFWRIVYVGAAGAYLGMFHLSLAGVLRVGGAGRAPHGHGLAMGLYFASWMVVVDGVRDVIAYAFPHQTAASVLHEAV